jgi:hypothetical protein
VDLAPVREAAANRPYPGRLVPDDLLAPLQPLGPAVDLAHVVTQRIGGATTSVATRSGTLHGICGCFVSTLAPGITIRNAPGDAETSNFAHTFLPLAEPIEVAAGDRIEIQADVFDGLEARWRVTATSAASGRRHRHEQSTLFAWPLSSEELSRERDDYCPRLTERGRIEQELLTKFDGATTSASLRAWLDARGGSALASPRARAAALKDAIARCG